MRPQRPCGSQQPISGRHGSRGCRTFRASRLNCPSVWMPGRAPRTRSLSGGALQLGARPRPSHSTRPTNPVHYHRISTPWRAPSQVGIVARSLAASGGALHLPGASTRVGAAKPWASVAPASRCKLPTPCAPHAAPRVRSTSSPRHRGRYSRTDPRPCAARGVALVRAGSEGARCGLHDAHASVYVVPQAREFNAKFKSGLLPKFRERLASGALHACSCSSLVLVVLCQPS